MSGDALTEQPQLQPLIACLAAPTGDLVVGPPGDGPGYWAGAPSALWHDGAVWLAYRLRRPVGEGRGYANVVARAADGVAMTTVATLHSGSFACASLERPALVRRPDGGWRLYVSCSTPGSLHWWVEAVDADRPEDLPAGRRTVVLAGDATTAWKDPVVIAGPDRWQMWVCRHVITDPSLADRMDTWYATSADGLAWEMLGVALAGRAGRWDARGARVASVFAVEGGLAALYDGRPDFAGNWEERTGVALGDEPGALQSVSDQPIGGPDSASVRYAAVVDVPGGRRVYYECSRPDGSHDLRSEYVPRPSVESQSPK